MTELADAPEILGRYELLTRLATGGMAELFLARERGLAGLERLVVIKRILPHLAHQPSFVEMFLREARIVARLSHPNVVQIYELGQKEESYYIAMEYIHGSTVRELLLLSQEQELLLPIDVTLSIVEQACRGLHAAHELRDLDGQPLGLVHRDISPHNLMCTSEGHVKLLDFGVAKSTAASVEATYSGNLKGKFAYLSPEQCLHEPLDRRSDVFAMGIVMWEMCTMRRLFKRRTELEMMQAVTGGVVPEPKQFREELPVGVQEVVLKALATDREDRFQSVEEMRQALSAAAESANLGLGEDRVAAFLAKVAGEKLSERQDTVASAFERALTASERRRLLHLTGSSSRSETIEAEEGPTVVERPGGNLEDTQRSSADQIQELARRDRRLSTAQDAPGEQTRASLKSESPLELSKRRIAIIAALTIVIGAAIVFAFGDFFADRDIEAVADAAEAEVVLSGDAITLGWAPTVDPEVLRNEIEPLHRYLERSTGRPVPMVITESYGDLSQQLLSGEVDIAALPPRLFVETERQDPEIEVLVFKEFDGSTTSDALLLVRTDEHVRRLDELEGRIFCFVDPMSTSGNFLPRQYIRDNGFDPDEFIGTIHWSGDHFQGMRDLIDGKCDAAATYSGAFLSGDEFGIRTGSVRTLAVTGFIPQDTITAGRHVSQDDRRLMRDAFLNFDPLVEFGVERMGDNQRITGFYPGSSASFDPLRQSLESAESLEAAAEEQAEGE